MNLLQLCSTCSALDMQHGVMGLVPLCPIAHHKSWDHYLQKGLQVAVLPYMVHGAVHKGDGPPLQQCLPHWVVREPH